MPVSAFPTLDKGLMILDAADFKRAFGEHETAISAVAVFAPDPRGLDQSLPTGCRRVPVIRENRVMIVSVGLSGSWNPCFPNENADPVGYHTISQSGVFPVISSGGWTANPCASSAAHCL
jgi:hypothetical protein